MGYKQSRHYQVRQRAHCILLSYEGVKFSELIDFFQFSRRTIYNWMNNWEEQRLLGLYNQTARGRKPTFNEEQKTINLLHQPSFYILFLATVLLPKIYLASCLFFINSDTTNQLAKKLGIERHSIETTVI